ncbi:MAG TPA: molybdate ABC transporter substrate-binding protein [Prolixibacteraceae bacterium]|nr:molybdate ABC transporter substrate-binding protein [Prolixibacteraceae bacterium]
MKKTTIFLLLALFSISMRAQTVKVAAAANLRFVFEEIKNSYMKANPRSDVVVNFGSTGALYLQIVNGADFNLFMAADDVVPVKLKAQGLVSGEVKTYAFGKLVLWSNTINVSKGMDVLTDPSVKRIAVAKPDLAPYGDRAVECLKSAGLLEKVNDKIVYADNISQTAQFAQTGNAEVGFLAYSLTLSPEMKGSTFEIDAKSYKPVAQAMAIVKGWKANPEAVKLMKYILSPECKPIFEKYGYIIQ